MSFISPHKLDVSQIVTQAKNALLCSDLDLLTNVLKPFLDEDRESVLQTLSHLHQAEISVICGRALYWIGINKNIPEYCDEGKDLLTKGNRLFTGLGEIDEANKAMIYLASSYNYVGEISEHDAILSTIENYYQNDQLNDVCFEIKANKLITLLERNDFIYALQLIEEIAPIIEFCSDNFVKLQFFQHSGLIYRKTKQLELAETQFLQALELTELLDNERMTARILNSLACLERDKGNFPLALEYSDSATKIYRKYNDYGYIAHQLDTTAGIEFARENYEEAHTKINASIQYFRQGTAYLGRCDALCLKIKVLLKLYRIEAALEVYQELIVTASTHLTEEILKNYRKEISQLLYVPHGTGYEERNRNFKKFQLSNALEEANTISEAANGLLISHQNLSEILDEQFPELREEFSIPKRSPRSDRIVIEPIKINNNFLFDEVVSGEISTYLLPKSLTNKHFKIREDWLLAVGDGADAADGDLILFQQNEIYSIGILEHTDEWIIRDKKTRKAYKFTEILIFGKIFGHFDYTKISNKSILFNSIHNRLAEESNIKKLG